MHVHSAYYQPKCAGKSDIRNSPPPFGLGAAGVAIFLNIGNIMKMFRGKVFRQPLSIMPVRSVTGQPLYVAQLKRKA